MVSVYPNGTVNHSAHSTRHNSPPVYRGVNDHDAEAMIEARHPETHRSAATVEQLATWSLSPKMRGLCIGTVWTAVMAGSFAMVDISISRAGELITRPSLNMRDG